MDRGDATFLAIVCGLLGFLLGASITLEIWDDHDLDFKDKAVKHGAAEWVVGDRGKTTFRWKGDTDEEL